MDDRELLQILQKNPENGMRLVMKEYTGLCYYLSLIHILCNLSD